LIQSGETLVSLKYIDQVYLNYITKKYVDERKKKQVDVQCS